MCVQAGRCERPLGTRDEVVGIAGIGEQVTGADPDSQEGPRSARHLHGPDSAAREVDRVSYRRPGVTSCNFMDGHLRRLPGCARPRVALPARADLRGGCWSCRWRHCCGQVGDGLADMLAGIVG